MMKGNPRAIIDVDMVHAARIGADTSQVISLQAGNDLLEFAARGVKVDRPVGGVITAFSRSCDAGARPDGTWRRCARGRIGRESVPVWL